MSNKLLLAYCGDVKARKALGDDLVLSDTIRPSDDSRLFVPDSFEKWIVGLIPLIKTVTKKCWACNGLHTNSEISEFCKALMKAGATCEVCKNTGKITDKFILLRLALAVAWTAYSGEIRLCILPCNGCVNCLTYKILRACQTYLDNPNKDGQKSIRLMEMSGSPEWCWATAHIIWGTDQWIINVLLSANELLGEKYLKAVILKEVLNV